MSNLEAERQMFLNEHDENVRLHTQLEEVVELLDQINGAFYSRTSKKAWLALMEKTKPLIQKVRAKYFQYAKQECPCGVCAVCTAEMDANQERTDESPGKPCPYCSRPLNAGICEKDGWIKDA